MIYPQNQHRKLHYFARRIWYVLYIHIFKNLEIQNQTLKLSWVLVENETISKRNLLEARIQSFYCTLYVNFIFIYKNQVCYQFCIKSECTQGYFYFSRMRIRIGLNKRSMRTKGWIWHSISTRS